MAFFLIYNGEIYPGDKPVILAQDRSFRYGDGVFETIRYSEGRIMLSDLHFERLFSAARQFLFNLPANWSDQFFAEQISRLCQLNSLQNARIRLSISRGTGDLYTPVKDFSPSFLIETFPLDVQICNSPALRMNIFREMKKAVAASSAVKSANYLLFLLAGIKAVEQGWENAVILNEYQRICEACSQNIFWISNKNIYTVPLSEGPVAGVFRRYLLMVLPAAGYQVQEKMLTEQEIFDCEELFITNAVQGIRAVSQLETRSFSTTMVSEIQQKIKMQYYG